MNFILCVSPLLLAVSCSQYALSQSPPMTSHKMMSVDPVPVPNRMKRNPVYGPPAPPQYPAPHPVYRPPYSAPPPYIQPIPQISQPVVLSGRDEVVVKEAQVVIDVDSAINKPKNEEKEEVEVVANTDNESSAKAKILPVNVNVTANAGVKVVVDALNNLLRKGLLPGGVLGGSTPAVVPAAAPQPVNVDVDVDVDLKDGTASEKHRVQITPAHASSAYDITADDMKKIEHKLEKLILEVKSGRLDS